MRIEIKEGNEFLFARIIIAKNWPGDTGEAKALLKEVYAKWPHERKAKFIVTCGGFCQFEWPQSISNEDIGDNKRPSAKVVKILREEAEQCARIILTDGLCEKLSRVADYITLGIDSFKEKISTTKNVIRQSHVELVFVVDLKNMKFHWTGKSYPTPGQEGGLVRIDDLTQHFFEFTDIGKVMVLGCHDLAVFTPRSKNAKGWRKKVNQEFRVLANRQKPVCVLHHPHTTVNKMTWLAAWNQVRKQIPSVVYYLGAGRYYEEDRRKAQWDKLDDVLKNTKRCHSIDFIVHESPKSGESTEEVEEEII